MRCGLPNDTLLTSCNGSTRARFWCLMREAWPKFSQRREFLHLYFLAETSELLLTQHHHAVESPAFPLPAATHCSCTSGLVSSSSILRPHLLR